MTTLNVSSDVSSTRSSQTNPQYDGQEHQGGEGVSGKSPLRLALLWTVFLGFALFSTWVLWQEGYWGIWQAGLVSAGSQQILIDLVIACLIISVWLRADAKAHGMNPVPWLLGVLTTGTIAILVYLLVREHRKP